MQKLRNVQKYDKISNTPFDQRSLIHREARFPPCFVGQRIPQNPIFLKNGKNQPKRKRLQKYAKISDSPFDQRSLIHREGWFPGGPRIPQNLIFWKNGKNHLKRKKSSKTQKLKNVQRYAKISDTPFDQRSLIHREAWFPPCFVGQNQQKNNFFLRGNFRQF